MANGRSILILDTPVELSLSHLASHFSPNGYAESVLCLCRRRFRRVSTDNVRNARRARGEGATELVRDEKERNEWSSARPGLGMRDEVRERVQRGRGSDRGGSC